MGRGGQRRVKAWKAQGKSTSDDLACTPRADAYTSLPFPAVAPSSPASAGPALNAEAKVSTPAGATSSQSHYDRKAKESKPTKQSSAAAAGPASHSMPSRVPTTPGPTSADLSKRCWALEGSAARALAGKVRMIIKARQNMSGRSSGVPGQHAAASERRKGASRGVHEEPDLQSLQPPGMGPPLAADRVSTTGGPAAAPVCRAEHPDAAGATAAAALAGPERSSGAAAVTVRNIPTAMPKFADSAFGSIAMERWRPFRARGTDTGLGLSSSSAQHYTRAPRARILTQQDMGVLSTEEKDEVASIAEAAFPCAPLEAGRWRHSLPLANPAMPRTMLGNQAVQQPARPPLSSNAADIHSAAASRPRARHHTVLCLPATHSADGSTAPSVAETMVLGQATAAGGPGSPTATQDSANSVASSSYADSSSFTSSAGAAQCKAVSAEVPKPAAVPRLQLGSLASTGKPLGVPHLHLGSLTGPAPPQRAISAAPAQDHCQVPPIIPRLQLARCGGEGPIEAATYASDASAGQEEVTESDSSSMLTTGSDGSLTTYHSAHSRHSWSGYMGGPAIDTCSPDSSYDLSPAVTKECLRDAAKESRIAALWPSGSPLRTRPIALPPAARALKTPLDLGSLSPEPDSGASELSQRQAELKRFQLRCSEVAPGIFVSGEQVAATKSILHRHGVTHVVNCISNIFHSRFPDDFTYLELALKDHVREEIASLFPVVFAFIEEAQRQGGRVLIHCSQGVSRSATLAIAWHMLATGLPYDKATSAIKEKRGIVNPNLGFMCQLLNWQTARQSGKDQIQLYNVVPHSAANSALMVLRPPHLQEQAALLHPRGVFVLRSSQFLYVWQGRDSCDTLIKGAFAGVRHLQRYEQESAEVQRVFDGQETQQFEDALQSYTNSLPEAGQSLARYGYCPHLAAQYKVIVPVQATPVACNGICNPSVDSPMTATTPSALVPGDTNHGPLQLTDAQQPPSRLSDFSESTNNSSGTALHCPNTLCSPDTMLSRNSSSNNETTIKASLHHIEGSDTGLTWLNKGGTKPCTAPQAAPAARAGMAQRASAPRDCHSASLAAIAPMTHCPSLPPQSDVSCTRTQHAAGALSSEHHKCGLQPPVVHAAGADGGLPGLKAAKLWGRRVASKFRGALFPRPHQQK